MPETPVVLNGLAHRNPLRRVIPTRWRTDLGCHLDAILALDPYGRWRARRSYHRPGSAMAT